MSSDTSSQGLGDDEEQAFWKLAAGASDVCRAVVLSPIDAPAALSAGLQMVGSSAPVLKVSLGSAVFMEVEQSRPTDEEALAVLLGDDRPLPEAVDQMARTVSKMASGGAVALTSWTSFDAEGVSGSITARRYVAGEPEQRLASGLVLANTDLVIEELLLGRITPEEAEAHTSRNRWTGWLRGPGFRG